MRISDWSSDVCSSDLNHSRSPKARPLQPRLPRERPPPKRLRQSSLRRRSQQPGGRRPEPWRKQPTPSAATTPSATLPKPLSRVGNGPRPRAISSSYRNMMPHDCRSEEHTSELQSLMRISYAVFCLKKKKAQHTNTKRTKTTQTLNDNKETLRKY